MILSETQALILKYKNEGLANTKIAKLVYPNAKANTARMMVSRQLNSKAMLEYVNATEQQALLTKNITWLRLITKLEKMLDSEKNIYNKDGEVLGSEPDTQSQQFAIKTLIPMLQRIKDNGKEPEPLSGELLKAITSGDPVELQRIVFNKS